MDELSISQVAGALRRHLFKSVAFFVAVVLLGWLALANWPRTYGSEAKLFVKVGRASVALDPTATTGQTLMMQKTQEEEINSALDHISSRALHEKLVDIVTPDAILSGQIGSRSDDLTSRSSYMNRKTRALVESVKGLMNKMADASRVRDPISDRERAIHRVGDMIEVQSPRNSMMISIYSKAKTPELAMELSKTMANLYLAEHLRVRQTLGSKEFFEETSQQLAEQLNQKSKEIRDYKQRHGILSIDDNRQVLRIRSEATDGSLQMAIRECEFTEAKIAELEDRIEQLPEEVVTSKESSTWSGMRQRLFELQVEEKRLMASASQDHPEVVKIRNQRMDLEKLLEDFGAETTDQRTAPNPIRQQLEQEMLAARAALAGERARLEGLTRQKSEISDRLLELAEHEVELTQLERELAILDQNLRRRESKLDEARISTELDAREISNVTIAQPATLVEKPVSPQKIPMLAGILMLGFLGSLAIPVAIESTSRKLGNEKHLTSELMLPVTARIPRVRSLRLGSSRKAIVSEQCARILQRVRSVTDSPKLGSIGLLSCDRNSSTSGLASQLAITAGTEYGLSTLLIDADYKLRTISKMFRLNGAPGLTELISTNAEFDECVQPSPYSNVVLMSPQSKTTASKPRLVRPADVAKLLDQFTKDYDLVILDLPASDSLDDGIAALVDNVFVVADEEKTSKSAAKEAIKRLRDANVQLMGLVLQGAKLRNER